jgi:hypothetical protein
MVEICGVPNSGDMLVWSVFDDSAALLSDNDGLEFDIYTYQNGIEEKMCTGKGEYLSYIEEYLFPCYVHYDVSGTAALVDSGTGTLNYIEAKGANNEIKTGGKEIGSVYFNNENNSLPKSLENFYVSTNTGNGYDLYAMNLAGDRAKIASDLYTAWQTEIINDTAYYLDENHDLFACEVKNGKAGDSEKIASNVSDYQLSQDGGIVWFTRENGDLDDLYVVKNGSAEKIASETTSAYPVISADGNSALYFLDTKDDIGELYLYRNGKSEKIASDVYTSSIVLYNRSFFDASNIPYIGNAYTEDDILMGNLYVYNGKESQNLVSGLLVPDWGMNAYVTKEDEGAAEAPAKEAPAKEAPAKEAPAAAPTEE